jgi:hypothetical protein
MAGGKGKGKGKGKARTSKTTTTTVTTRAPRPPPIPRKLPRAGQLVVETGNRRSNFATVNAVRRELGRDAPGKLNTYFAQLVDPEKFPGHKYPDDYARDTACLQLVKQEEQYYFPANSVVEDPGAYYGIWRPSLVHPLWIYGPFDEQFNPNWCLVQQDSRFGVRSLNGSSASVTEQDNQPWLPNGQFMNIQCPLVYRDKDFVQDPYEIQRDDGSTMYGHTFQAGTGTPAIRFNIQVLGNMSVNDTIDITVVNHSTGINVNAVAAANQLSFELTTGSLATLFKTELGTGSPLNGKLCVGREDALGFIIKYTSAAVNNSGIVLLAFQAQLEPSAGLGTSQLGLHPVDFPDQKELVDKVTLYRPTGSSMWVAYQGSTLDDGGQHAVTFYSGGRHPNSSNLYTYDLIAQYPKCYENKMKVGSYSYWKPLSTKDTQMREVLNPDEWTHGWIVWAGFVGSVTQAKPLRLRGFTNFEIVSSANIWTYTTGRSAEWMIREVALKLRHAPTSMENDTHWQTIYNWIKDRGTDLAKFWNNNKEIIIPVAKAGIAVGSMLL